MPTFLYGNFEWDEDKEQKNIEKHNISFRDAMAVFHLDRYTSEPYLHKTGEMRSFCVTILEEVGVTVVYTWRGERIRIISARRASNEEREYYRNRSRS